MLSTAPADGKTGLGQRLEGATRSGKKAAPAEAKSSSPGFAPALEARKTGAKPEDPTPQSPKPDQNNDQNQNQSQDPPQTPGLVADLPNRPATATNGVVTSPAATASNSASVGIPGRESALQSDAAAPRIEENTVPAPIVVQSARVLERMGQTEMRVGVNTASFGNVELRTTLNQDQVGASIATSHMELHAAMMAEMPSLERAMAQHHLRLDSLDLNARGGAHDSGSSAGSQSQSQPGAGFKFSAAGDPVEPPDSLSTPAWTAAHSAGLNVHA